MIEKFLFKNRHTISRPNESENKFLKKANELKKTDEQTMCPTVDNNSGGRLWSTVCGQS